MWGRFAAIDSRLNDRPASAIKIGSAPGRSCRCGKPLLLVLSGVLIPKDILFREIDFVLWMLVALIGLGLFGTATPSHGGSGHPASQVLGFGLLAAGPGASIPHARKSLEFFPDLIAPTLRRIIAILTQDRTLGGIPFNACARSASLRVSPGITATGERGHFLETPADGQI
jgi:hypothetical protein